MKRRSRGDRPTGQRSLQQRLHFGLPRVCVRDILREIRHHMPFRHTIAAKIFGLAIIRSEEFIRLRERYGAAQRSYLAQDWDTAEAGFRECLQIRLNDGPSRVLLERIQLLRRNPPGKDWNGVWHLREK